MFNWVKAMMRRGIYGNKASTEIYIKHLKKIGVKMGEDVSIYSPIKTVIDEQYPWMISIGSHVRITEGVEILTHDYSWAVLKRVKYAQKPGAILGNAGKVEIGNNVFIGINTIILGGVKIGDNVIIGAGSVVTKSIPNNCVAAGVPAKVIMSIDDYYKKRACKQVEEACMLAREYKKRFSSFPPKEIFHEFFMVFTDSTENINEEFLEKMKLCNNYEESVDYLNGAKSSFKSYEEFMEYCFGTEWRR